MSIDNTFSSTTAPRPVPASSDLHRWDLLEILNPPLSPPTRSRGRKMSLDFSTKAPQSLYGQSDIDQSFNVPNSENASILFCFVSFFVAHHEFRPRVWIPPIIQVMKFSLVLPRIVPSLPKLTVQTHLRLHLSATGME